MVAPANVMAVPQLAVPAAESKREAFEREALPHLDSVYRFAVGLTGDPYYAEDLTQEAMLRAFRSWHRYRPGTNVRAWLTTILRNVAISNYRRQRPVAHSYDFNEIEESIPSPRVADSDPEERLLDGLTAQEVIAAIHTLEPEFRDTVLLRDVGGLSYEEVAEQTGVPVGTVKSRLYRGRRALHSVLEAHAADAGVV
jgi:RNA polymerase sigma-70 factor (ECF subfamily)